MSQKINFSTPKMSTFLGGKKISMVFTKKLQICTVPVHGGVK